MCISCVHSTCKYRYMCACVLLLDWVSECVIKCVCECVCAHWAYIFYVILYLYIYILYLYILIGWQAYRGDKNTLETLLYTTRKSNTGKVIRHLARLYTYKTLLTADFGQIWGSRKLGSRSARNLKFCL